MSSPAIPKVQSQNGSDGDPSSVSLKHIEDILMEEDKEVPMSLDSMALQAVEGSFCEVCFEKPSPSSASKVSFTSESGSIGSFSNDPCPNTLPLPNSLSRDEYVVQFERGVEEGKKFIPSTNLLNFNFENKKLSPQLMGDTSLPAVEVDQDEESEESHIVVGKRKNLQLYVEEEWRSEKKAANVVEDDELWKLFDGLSLTNDKLRLSLIKLLDDATVPNGGGMQLLQKMQATQSIGFKVINQRSKEEAVGLSNLLLRCARAVEANDCNDANEVLKKIWKHSSPSGDGFQRCAYYFAKGLEARLTGTRTHMYAALYGVLLSPADFLKVWKGFAPVCFFRKVCNWVITYHLLKLAEKSPTLHVIDFGIFHGFQWGMVIQYLSARHGGPPKLRITGIENPFPGLDPAEVVKRTGRRLTKYCERFDVPFEYNGIAKEWKTIQLEELKIDPSDATAVILSFRLEKILDVVVGFDSPRSTVLRLIREINPDIFIHSALNASYNTSLFFPRFRAALSYFSLLFDMVDANIGRESQERLMFEKHFIGWDILNVVASEGLERVDRPETFKQWQRRIERAGFRQLTLDREVVRAVKAGFDGRDRCTDFSFRTNGNWMVQVWKGREVCGMCCWVPARQSRRAPVRKTY